jgi:UDP-3-O-[3-hydroxymyristoyl] glucosamine N-acyltransferase LpxD
MGVIMVLASEVARLLHAELRHGDVAIDKVCPLGKAEPGCLAFANACSPEIAAKLNGTGRLFVIAASDVLDGRLAVPHIVVERPRLAFARAVAAFFAPRRPPAIAPTAVIGTNVRIGVDVCIGHYSVIGDNVVIGDRTEIRHHVVVADNVVIGADCLVKSHAVVGEEGFGVVYDEEDRTLRVPHVGRLVIGDRVEIGAFNSVCQATIGTTVLGDGVKADDHVHFSHNCIVEHDSILTAHSEVGAQVHVGHHAWFGPNSCTIEKTRIEPWGFIGIGSTVVRDVKSETVVFGNPARYARLRDRDKE